MGHRRIQRRNLNFSGSECKLSHWNLWDILKAILREKLTERTKLMCKPLWGSVAALGQVDFCPISL